MPSVPVWYSKGQAGAASGDREAMMQLPVSFLVASSPDDWSQDLAAAGKPMLVGFHRSGLAPGQVKQYSHAMVQHYDATGPPPPYGQRYLPQWSASLPPIPLSHSVSHCMQR